MEATVLTPRGRVLLKRITVPQLVQKFPTFCGTMFTSFIVLGNRILEDGCEKAKTKS